MKKEELVLYINQGLSMRKIAKIKGVSYPTINHWVKKHGLSTQTGGIKPFKCPCGETNPENFYGHKRSICGKCHNDYNIKKARESKLFAIDYLGGKCMNCGYNRCEAALDLHHKDPSLKHIKFKSAKYWNRDRFKTELDKCALLCRNCHQEEHYMVQE